MKLSAPAGWVMTESCAASQPRTARKARHCGGCGCGIRIGDAYLMLKSFPGHDSGYATYAGHPVTMPECARCAYRYGRGHLLDAVISYEQVCRDGLL